MTTAAFPQQDQYHPLRPLSMLEGSETIFDEDEDGHVAMNATTRVEHLRPQPAAVSPALQPPNMTKRRVVLADISTTSGTTSVLVHTAILLL